MSIDFVSTDAIPIQVAEVIRSLFIGAEFEREEQSDLGYYKNIRLVGWEGETYTSDFWHSPQLLDVLHPVIQKHFAPVLYKYGGQKEIHFRAYKMNPGGHYRMHVDDAGETGFIWYLNKRWLIDWGGLLIQEGALIVPEFNKLVIRRAKRPHFVTEVAKHAKEPRYMVVGFL